MKVERRVSSCSPSLVLLNGSKPAGSATPTNGTTKYYQFQLEPHHVIDNGGKGGQKVFVCDIDGCIFKRSFSLKRHYLRFHINFSFLSPRDINNCAIAIASQQLRSGSTFPIGKKDPIFRCHQCGYLTESKHDLLKHLEIHPTSGITEVNDGDTSLSRCPRCSTAFSMRKTLLRHIKKNRCREDVTTLPESTLVGNGDDPSEDSNSSSSATVWKEEEDVDENSLLDSSCPRFTCTFCLKMFNSYVTLCRHRQLVHSHRHGICSPKLLLQSRKSTGQKSELSSIDFSSYTRNVRENLDEFVVGKRTHIKAIPIEDEEKPTELSQEEHNSEDRWSWGHADGNFLQDVLRMDVPLQQALYRGLKELPESTANHDLESEPSHPETEKLVAALQLRPADQILSNGTEPLDIEKPSLSGEWTRRKCYICLPCGKIFQDFLSLLDHQHVSHVSVWCSHIQLEKTLESDVSSELIRQIGRGSLPAESSADLKCTKCQNKVHSLPELHDHILQCSNHTIASPCRRVRSRSKNGGSSSIVTSSNAKSNQWLRGVSGRSKGMQRTHSKNSFVSSPSSQLRCLRQRSHRSSKEDQRTDGSKAGSSNGTPLKNAKRELFTSKDGKKKKKKKTDPNLEEKRVLRSKTEVTNSKANVKSLKKEVQKQVSKPKKKKSGGALRDPLHECDACHKQFKSQTSVLKHKHYCPNTTVATSSEPEDKDDEDFIPPVSASSSSRKSLQAEVNKPASSSSVKLKKKSPTSSESKSKLGATVTSPSRRGNHVPAEAAKKGSSPKSAKKSIQNATPSKIKTLTEKNPKNKLKEEVVTPKKNKILKRANEEEENSLVTARPIRSSRKTMTPLVMEDQVEAHFNEALSPEQRVQVAEQICPFCIKHYVYKSNFKKHLLEGCNSNGETERPPSVNNLITVPVDTPKRPVPSSTKKSSPVVVNNVNGHSSKEDKRKKEKIVSEVPKKKKKEKEELHLSNGDSKKTKKAMEVLKKSSKWKDISATKKKNKLQVVPKKIGKLTNGLKLKKKASIASKKSAVFTKTKVKKMEIAPGKETKKKKSSSNWTPSNDNRPFNGFSNGISESDTEVLNVEFIVKDLTIPAVGEPDADVAILPFESSNTCTMDTELAKKCIPNGDEKSSLDGLEASSVVILSEQSVSDDENKLIHHSNGLKSTSPISSADGADDQCTESDVSTLLIKSTRSSTLKEKLRSYPLDGSTLGQSIENAIQSGFLKPYLAVTKYPLEVRLLKQLAMDYCEFKEAVPSPAN